MASGQNALIDLALPVIRNHLYSLWRRLDDPVALYARGGVMSIQNRHKPWDMDFVLFAKKLKTGNSNWREKPQ